MEIILFIIIGICLFIAIVLYWKLKTSIKTQDNFYASDKYLDDICWCMSTIADKDTLSMEEAETKVFQLLREYEQELIKQGILIKTVPSQALAKLVSECR